MYSSLMLRVCRSLSTCCAVGFEVNFEAELIEWYIAGVKVYVTAKHEMPPYVWEQGLRPAISLGGCTVTIVD